jgi:hypothetical protein
MHRAVQSIAQPRAAQPYTLQPASSLQNSKQSFSHLQLNQLSIPSSAPPIPFPPVSRTSVRRPLKSLRFASIACPYFNGSHFCPDGPAWLRPLQYCARRSTTQHDAMATTRNNRYTSNFDTIPHFFSVVACVSVSWKSVMASFPVAGSHPSDTRLPACRSHASDAEPHLQGVIGRVVAIAGLGLSRKIGASHARANLSPIVPM